MSSLLQFAGKTGRKGVQLQAYKVTRVWTKGSYDCPRYLFPYSSPFTITIRTWSYSDHETEPEHCHTCNQTHPKLYGFWRKPRGMFGCWVVFAYNGEKHVPDLSIPIQLQKLPHDAKELPLEIWHDC